METKTVLGILIAIGVVFGLGIIGFAYDEFFLPKHEALRTKIFHESQSYNDGMIRDLEDLKLQYIQANDTSKAALRSVIIHRFSIYPKEKLPSDLQQFYLKLTGEAQ